MVKKHKHLFGPRLCVDLQTSAHTQLPSIILGALSFVFSPSPYVLGRVFIRCLDLVPLLGLPRAKGPWPDPACSPQPVVCPSLAVGGSAHSLCNGSWYQHFALKISRHIGKSLYHLSISDRSLCFTHLPLIHCASTHITYSSLPTAPPGNPSPIHTLPPSDISYCPKPPFFHSPIWICMSLIKSCLVSLVVL